MKQTRKFWREIKVKDEFTRCPSSLICHQIIDGLPCKTGGKFCTLFRSSYLTKFGPKRTTKISQNHLMFLSLILGSFWAPPIDLTSFFVVSNEIFDWSLHRDFHPFALLTALDCATKGDSEVSNTKSSMNFRRTLQLQNEFICFTRRPNSIDIKKYLLPKYFNLGFSWSETHQKVELVGIFA